MIPIWLIKAGVGVVLLGGIVAAVRHNGYIAGASERNAYWQPLFVAAEVAAKEANDKTARIEAAQIEATTDAEARYDKMVQDINTAAADSQHRIRALSLRLQANSASRCEVSEVPNAPGHADEPTPSEERAFRIGDAISGIGRRCELDSATLESLQAWVRQQAALGD